MSTDTTPTFDTPPAVPPVPNEPNAPVEPPAPADPVAVTADFPAGEPQTLHLRVGACRLRLHPLAETESVPGAWLRGQYNDPAGALPLRVEQETGVLRVTQAPMVASFPSLIGTVPTLDLGLGAGRPYALLLETGASDCSVELGGLPLTEITLRLGAGRADVSVSAPAPLPVARLRADVGAGELRLRGVGRLACPDMAVAAGAASVVIDFGERPTVPVNLSLETGLAGGHISTPANTPVRVKRELVLGDLKLDPTFVRNEEAWWTPAALAGERPLISVVVRGALSGFTLGNEKSATAQPAHV